MNSKKDNSEHFSVNRREFIGATVVGSALAAVPLDAQTPAASGGASGTAAPAVHCTLSINGQSHALDLDSRVTLLDALREHLHMAGTKKGCDHGQCGACTVLINGQRVNSCLKLALSVEGDQITTIEGLGQENQLHPVQAAFLEHDGFQCGYCTPGQICSAVALGTELKQGHASAATRDVSATAPITLTDDEIRERMSGNICRCGAYPNIVTAVRTVYGGRTA